MVRSFTEFARAGLGEWGGIRSRLAVLVLLDYRGAGGGDRRRQYPARLDRPRFLAAGRLGLMAVMTAVNLMSARSYGEFEFWFASIKVAAILVFICLAAPFAFGLTSPPARPSPTWPSMAALCRRAGWRCWRHGHRVLRHDRRGDHHHRGGGIEGAGRAMARMRTTVIVRILTFYVISMFLIVSVMPWHGALGRIAVHPGPEYHAVPWASMP